MKKNAFYLKALTIFAMSSSSQVLAETNRVAQSSSYNIIDFYKGFTCTGTHNQNSMPIKITFEDFDLSKKGYASGRIKEYLVGNKEVYHFVHHPRGIKYDTVCDSKLDNYNAEAFAVAGCTTNVETTGFYDAREKETILSTSIRIYAATPVTEDESSVTYKALLILRDSPTNYQQILQCKFHLEKK